MARQRTHVVVGVAAGAAGAAYWSRGNTPSRLAETVGGGIGGALGGVLSDLVEPAINSWHRSIAHSYSAIAVGLATVSDKMVRWQEYCREQAALHDRMSQASLEDWWRAWHTVCALLWRLAGGFLVGVAVGYLSHLALDQVTPRGLPLLM